MPSAYTWWRVLSNAAFLVPAWLCARKNEPARALLLLALVAVSSCHHYYTDAGSTRAAAWTRMDHAASVSAGVVMFTLLPFGPAQQAWDAAFTLAVVVTLLLLVEERGVGRADSTQWEGVAAATFLAASLLLTTPHGPRRTWRLLCAAPVWQALCLCGTVAYAGLVMFQYNYGEAVMHGLWHVNAALLFSVLVYRGRASENLSPGSSSPRGQRVPGDVLSPGSVPWWILGMPPPRDAERAPQTNERVGLGVCV